MALIPPEFVDQVEEKYRLSSKRYETYVDLNLLENQLPNIDSTLLIHSSLDDNQEKYPVLDGAPDWNDYWTFYNGSELVAQSPLNLHYENPGEYSVINYLGDNNLALYWRIEHGVPYVYWDSEFNYKIKVNSTFVYKQGLYFDELTLIPPISWIPTEVKLQVNIPDLYYSGGTEWYNYKKYNIGMQSRQFIKINDKKFRLNETGLIYTAIPTKLSAPSEYPKYYQIATKIQIFEPVYSINIIKNKYQEDTAENQAKINLIIGIKNNRDYKERKEYKPNKNKSNITGTRG